MQPTKERRPPAAGGGAHNRTDAGGKQAHPPPPPPPPPAPGAGGGGPRGGTSPCHSSSWSWATAGGAAPALTAKRHAGAAASAARLGRAAIRSPLREGSPANTTTPPGASTRANSPQARS